MVAVLCFATACGEPEGPSKIEPDVITNPGTDGYNLPAGSGANFIVDSFVIAEGNTFDLHVGTEPGGLLNKALNTMLDKVNDHLEQVMLQTGRMIPLVEIAGAEDAEDGEDDEVTLKFYVCHDADGDPSNNLCGGPGCGRVVAEPESMDGDQPTLRSWIAPMQQHVIETGFDTRLNLELWDDEVAVIERLRIRLEASPNGDALFDGVLCGAMSATSAAALSFPICTLMPAACAMLQVSEMSTAQFMGLAGYQPDVDLDGDGLETFHLDGSAQVDSCTDGDGRQIQGADCLSDPAMADGFSICFGFHAVPGELVIAAPDAP